MKFDSVLKSNHDLKKNGYKILRKLHKMEKQKGAEVAYKAAFNNTYFFVLSIKSLVNIINIEYPKANQFKEKCDAFLQYLDSVANKKSRINSSMLASFLHAYTIFFNSVIENGHPFIFDQILIQEWNTRCLMAYIATWGLNH